MRISLKHCSVSIEEVFDEIYHLDIDFKTPEDTKTLACIRYLIEGIDEMCIDDRNKFKEFTDAVKSLLEQGE